MRTLEDDMLRVRGYLDEAEARRRQPANAAAQSSHPVPPAPGEPVPASEPPAGDQLSLF
jgi:hypothetical protein